MKKNFIILSVFVAISAQAQHNFGIKAGYNSTLSFTTLAEVQSGDYTLENVKADLQSGFHAGIFVRFNVNHFYVQQEVLYNTQRKICDFTIQSVTKEEITHENVPVEQLFKFSFVDIPVLFGYKLFDEKRFNLRVFAGPKFRLNANSKISYEKLTDEGKNSIDFSALSNEFKKSQIGLEGGVGVDFLMFSLDCKINLIPDIYQATWETKPDWNSNIALALAWKLN